MLRFSKYLLALLFILFGIKQQIASAATPLPSADWYAITWVRETNTLHWINENGEQGSMARPTWTEEALDAVRDLYISPDGTTLVQIIKQANGFEGIGFYDLKTGQFTNTHQTQPDESFVLTEHYPMSSNNQRFAIGLTQADANFWRIINFELPSGDAISQLTSKDFDTGLSANQYYPYVVDYQLDEAIGQFVIYFQMHTELDDATYDMMYWYPEFEGSAQVPQVFGTGFTYNDGSMNTMPLNPNKGFDIMPVTGFPVNAYGEGSDSTQIEAVANGVPTASLYTEASGVIDQVHWLNSGNWISYHFSNEVQSDHWRVLNINNTSQPIPLASNLSSLHGTPDGFLAIDTTNTRLAHVTDLNFEDFAENIGATLFQPFAEYHVIYVTPQNSSFNLASIPSSSEADITLVDSNDNQEVVSGCELAPMSRLTVGQLARVTFTDGSPLNIRSHAAGEVLIQIPEGTITTVLDGPICVDNYFWWQLQVESGGVITVGWSAEGDSISYYLEPYAEASVNDTTNPSSDTSDIDVTGIQSDTTSENQSQPIATNNDCLEHSQLIPGGQFQTTGYSLPILLDSTGEWIFPNVQDGTPLIGTVVEFVYCQDPGIPSGETSARWRVQVPYNGQLVLGIAPEYTHEVGPNGCCVPVYRIEPYTQQSPIPDECDATLKPPVFADGTLIQLTLPEPYILVFENLGDSTPTARIPNGETPIIVGSPVCYLGTWMQQVRYDTGFGPANYWIVGYDQIHGFLYTNQLD